MMSKQDRESILEGMKALKRMCRKIEKESVHCEQITIDDRQFTVTWMLGFDDELLAFEASVSAIPAGTDAGIRNDEGERSEGGRGGVGRPEAPRRGDKVCVELENYIQDRLDGLKEYEPWPDAIPSAWLVGAAEILIFPAESPAAPDAG